MRHAGVIAAVVAAIVGISLGSCDRARTPPGSDPTPSVTAGRVMDVFTAEGLPTRGRVDSSDRCRSMTRGCLELITSEDVAVYRFGVPSQADDFAQGLGRDGRRIGRFVVSYAGARTPEALRERYAEAASRAIGRPLSVTRSPGQPDVAGLVHPACSRASITAETMSSGSTAVPAVWTCTPRSSIHIRVARVRPFSAPDIRMDPMSMTRRMSIR